MQVKQNYDSGKVSFEQLPEMVFQLTKEINELKTFLRSNLQEQNKQTTWLNIEQMAEYIHRSKAWIYQRTKNARHELPPFHGTAGMILFKKCEVDAWLEGGAS